MAGNISIATCMLVIINVLIQCLQTTKAEQGNYLIYICLFYSLKISISLFNILFKIHSKLQQHVIFKFIYYTI